MIKKTYILTHTEARRRAQAAVADAPDGYAVTVGEANRSLDQNAAQWPILQAFADQKQLAINGVLAWCSKEDWKDVLTATFRGEMRVAIFDGRMILLGQRTSKFGKKTFGEWLEYLHAMAAQMDINLDYAQEA